MHSVPDVCTLLYNLATHARVKSDFYSVYLIGLNVFIFCLQSSSSTNRRPNSQQSFHSSNTSRHQHSSASQGPQPAPAQPTGTRLTTNNISTTRHQPSVTSQQQQPTPTIRLSNNNLNADQLAPSRCIRKHAKFILVILNVINKNHSIALYSTPFTTNRERIYTGRDARSPMSL